MKAGIRLHLRDGDHPRDLAIGPGKIALLEAVARTGSISAAAKSLGMSYRRAWLLVDATNRCLVRPAVATVTGGTQGGGAALTPTGAEFVRRYRLLERETAAAAARKLNALLRPLPPA